MTRVYSVPGVSCDLCKNSIEGAVSKLAAVDEVVVDIGARVVRAASLAPEAVVRAASLAPEAVVRAAITGAGSDVAGTTSP